MALAVTPPGIETVTGELASVVPPFPSSPSALSPQAYSTPLDPMAITL